MAVAHSMDNQQVLQSQKIFYGHEEFSRILSNIVAWWSNSALNEEPLFKKFMDHTLVAQDSLKMKIKNLETELNQLKSDLQSDHQELKPFWENEIIQNEKETKKINEMLLFLENFLYDPLASEKMHYAVSFIDADLAEVVKPQIIPKQLPLQEGSPQDS